MEINSINKSTFQKINENGLKNTCKSASINHEIKNSSLDGLNALANQNIAFYDGIDKVVKTGIELAQEKKLLPEFLYHLTTPNNYQSMKKMGKIIPSQEGSTGLSGVFTFDLANFLNHWGKICDGNTPLDRKLINRIMQAGNGEIALLKIPTEQMSPDLFKVRSQKLIFDMQNEVEYLPNPYFASKTDLMIDNFNENYWHMIKAAPLQDSQKYDEAGHAIEYIFNGEIPMDSVQLVGNADIQDCANSTFDNFASNIMTKLLDK